MAAQWTSQNSDLSLKQITTISQHSLPLCKSITTRKALSILINLVLNHQTTRQQNLYYNQYVYNRNHTLIYHVLFVYMSFWRRPSHQPVSDQLHVVALHAVKILSEVFLGWCLKLNECSKMKYCNHLKHGKTKRKKNVKTTQRGKTTDVWRGQWSSVLSSSRHGRANRANSSMPVPRGDKWEQWFLIRCSARVICSVQ